MPVFMMFGNYTSEALKGVSAERTDKVVKLLEGNDGKVRSMYAVLGEHDLIFIVEFPDTERAMIASVAVEKLTGISFRTSPVVDVDRFDRMVGEAKTI